MTRDKGGVLELMQIPDKAIGRLASAEKLSNPLAALFICTLALACWYGIFALIKGVV